MADYAPVASRLNRDCHDDCAGGVPTVFEPNSLNESPKLGELCACARALLPVRPKIFMEAFARSIGFCNPPMARPSVWNCSKGVICFTASMFRPSFLITSAALPSARLRYILLMAGPMSSVPSPILIQ